MTDTDEAQESGGDSPAMTIAEADAALTGPGGFFEIVTETVNGVEMGVVVSPHSSLRDLLAASANHGGDGSARYYLFDDGRSATYSENIDHAAAVAAALSQRYGVEPGDRVGLLGSNQPGWIQGFWGTGSAGAIAVAMNGWWKGDEIRYGIELTEPKVLIADRRRLERLDGDPGVPVIGMDPEPDGGETVDSLIDTYAGSPLPGYPIAVDDPAAILFTSGTTGRPRGAIQTHRNFFAYLTCAFMIGGRQFLRFPGETMDVGGPTLACSPLFHVSGLHACAVMAVGAGFNPLWTTGRYDAEKILRLTEEHGIARWSGVTTQVWRLVEHPRLRDYDTSSVASIGGGGAGWVPSLPERCPTAPPPPPLTLPLRSPHRP
ncbi:MAG: class I adenylate-forming enzyme family protein, partial [Acidimicrobiaceae bacterium]|nr:class I adenylate-forming enzyme family protein [Acidimicrobiaceae bacterium]